MKKTIITIISLLLSILIFSTCSKEIIKKTESKNPRKDDKKERLEKEYMKEGFINTNTFRVIIVSTESERIEDLKSIEKRIKKRALTSLKKYIISKGKSFAPQVNSALLNLINDHGKLSQNNKGCLDDYVFIYDIRKKNIKFSIETLSKNR